MSTDESQQNPTPQAASQPQDEPMIATDVISWDSTIEAVVGAIHKQSGFSYFKVTGPSAAGKIDILAKIAAESTLAAGMSPYIILSSGMEAEFLTFGRDWTSTWKQLHCDSTARGVCLQKLRSGGTLIVKLDGQRTVASDFVQLSISELISKKLKEDKNWVLNLIVFSSFQIPRHHILGRLAYPSISLGFGLEESIEVEESLPLPIVEHSSDTSWEELLSTLVNDAERQMNPDTITSAATILCFLPIDMIRRPLKDAESLKWQIVVPRDDHNIKGFKAIYSRKSEAVPPILAVIYRTSDLTSGSVSVPNLKHILMSDTSVRVVFDPHMGQPMETVVKLSRRELYQRIGFARKVETIGTAAIHCNFDLPRALDEVEWDPKPDTENEFVLDWLYTCICKWPNTPNEEWPVASISDVMTVAEAVFKLEWMGIIEVNSRARTYRVTKGWAELVLSFLPGGQITPSGMVFNSAVMLAEVCHAFKANTIDAEVARVCIRMAVVMSVGMPWKSNNNKALATFVGQDIEKCRLLLLKTLPGVTAQYHSHGSAWLCLGLWEVCRAVTLNFTDDEHFMKNMRLVPYTILEGSFNINPPTAQEIWDNVSKIEVHLGLRSLKASETLPKLEREQSNTVEMFLARAWLPNLLCHEKNIATGLWENRSVLSNRRVSLEPDMSGPSLEHFYSDRGDRSFLLYRQLRWSCNGGKKNAIAECSTLVSNRALWEAVGDRSLHDLRSRYPGVWHNARD